MSAGSRVMSVLKKACGSRFASGSRTRTQRTGSGGVPALYHKAMTDVISSALPLAWPYKANGGGVGWYEDKGAYHLYLVETEAPIARLKPTGTDDEVRIAYWSHRQRWQDMNFGVTNGRGLRVFCPARIDDCYPHWGSLILRCNIYSVAGGRAKPGNKGVDFAGGSFARHFRFRSLRPIAR
jgi:hypothetical protein